MGITIEDLLQTPFSTRTAEEKLKILAEGRPRPHLQAVIETIKINNKTTPTTVLENLYNDYRWLTGCDIKQRLYCWSCLLFVEELTQWNSKGYNDMKHIHENIMKHKRTVSHVQGLLDMQMYLHQNTQVVDAFSILQQHNQLVKRNRDLIKRIIDVVLHMLQTRSPPLHKDSGDSNYLNVDECIKCLEFLKNYDLPNIIDDAIELLKLSPAIMTDIVEALKQIMKLVIKKETQLSTYVSVILSEHSDVDSKSQISTILRYMKGGKVCERFIGFTTLNEYKSSDAIFKHIINVVTEYGITERFLAFACDGAVVESTKHLSALIARVRQDYPCSFFTPYYFHRLHYILIQILSRIPECHHFFKCMNSIKTYILSDSKVWDILSELTNGGIPKLANEDWCNPEFLRVLKRRRRQFILVFEYVVDNCEQWNEEEVAMAQGYQQILQEFQTVFLLETFYKLFGYTAALDRTLSSNTPQNVFGSDMTDTLENHLTVERDQGFENLWVTVIGECLGMDEQKPRSLKTAMEEETKLMYRELFLKIIDSLVHEIDARFEPVQVLDFFHILNYKKHGKLVISYDQINRLLSVHGPYFEETTIKHELKVLCVNRELFGSKTVHELHDTFVKANLKGALEYIYKLSELILTVPCTPPSLTDYQSKVDSVARWCYIPDSTEAPGDASLLLLEQDLLEELKQRIFFHDEVILKFFELNKSIDVMYR